MANQHGSRTPGRRQADGENKMYFGLSVMITQFEEVQTDGGAKRGQEGLQRPSVVGEKNPVPLGNSVSCRELGFCCGIRGVAGTFPGWCCRLPTGW
jgi:hypothetical protein